MNINISAPRGRSRDRTRAYSRNCSISPRYRERSASHRRRSASPHRRSGHHSRPQSRTCRMSGDRQPTATQTSSSRQASTPYEHEPATHTETNTDLLTLICSDVHAEYNELVEALKLSKTRRWAVKCVIVLTLSIYAISTGYIGTMTHHLD